MDVLLILMASFFITKDARNGGILSPKLELWTRGVVVLLLMDGWLFRSRGHFSTSMTVL